MTDTNGDEAALAPDEPAISRIDQAVIRECFREIYRALKYPTQAAAGAALLASSGKNPRFSSDAAIKYVKGQTTGNLSALSVAALSILAKNTDLVIIHYERDVELRDYILSIIRKHKGIDHRRNLDIIFGNFRHSQKRGTRAFSTGVYQIFRRYKPTPFERTKNPDEYANPDTHLVVCEILFADADTMECTLITAQRNIYHGVLYINNENILFGIVQRPTKENAGIHQRFFSLHLERWLPMYSALMMKTGETSGRPVAAECIYVEIPKNDEHTALHKEVDCIVGNSWEAQQIESSSIIMDYITALPPHQPRGHSDWARVKYVRDFPALSFMAQELGTGKAWLREPSRTLGPDTIDGICKEVQLPVFRHSTFGKPQLDNAAG